MADSKKPKSEKSKAGQFKSGNQFGRRPRKPKPPEPYDDFHKVMRRKVTLKRGGAPQKITIRKALLIRLREEAQKGVKWAIHLSGKLIEAEPPPAQYSQEEQDKRELDNIRQELFREDILKLSERYRTDNSGEKDGQ